MDEFTPQTLKVLAQAMKLRKGNDEEQTIRVALKELVKSKSVYLQEVALKLMSFCARNGVEPLDILIFAERRFGQVYAAVGPQDTSGEVTISLTGDGLKRLSALCSSGTMSPSEMIEELLTSRWKDKFTTPTEDLEPVFLDDDLAGKLEKFCPPSMPISTFVSSLLRSLVSDSGRKILTERGMSSRAWWDDIAENLEKDEEEFGRFLSSIFSSEIDGDTDLDEWRKQRRAGHTVRRNVMISSGTLAKVESLRKIYRMGVSEYLELGMLLALERIRALIGLEVKDLVEDEEAEEALEVTEDKQK